MITIWCFAHTSAGDNYNVNVVKGGNTFVNEVTNQQPNLDVNVQQEGDTYIQKEQTLPGTITYKYNREPDQ